MAAKNGNTDVVKFLLKSGADINLKDIAGQLHTNIKCLVYF